MKKVWIILAIVIVAALTAFILLQNRDVPPSSDAILEVEKLAQTDKQLHEIDGVELSGKVIDGLTKKPLTAKIKVKDGDRVVATTDCNATGVFSIPLNDGNYEITVEHPQYVKKGKFDVDRLIEIDGEPVKLDDLELWPEAIVKGRVVSDYQGVEAELQFIYQKDNSGAKHYLFNTVKTDQEGYFTLDNAYGGIQNIRISSDNFMSQKLSDIALTPGETVDLGDIPMKLGLTVFGVVKDENTQKGISGASVLCVNSNRKIVAETQTADDGSYTLPVVDLNKLRVIVTADGFHSNGALLEIQNQNRYEYNVALTKLDEKKPAKNPPVQPPKDVENNDTQAQQDDEQDNAVTEKEANEYRDKVKNAVRDNHQQFVECYKILLEREPSSGSVIFYFYSSSSGDIFDITIEHSDIHDEEFLECLTDVVANFRFPQRTDGSIAGFSYPFEFGAKKD